MTLRLTTGSTIRSLRNAKCEKGNESAALCSAPTLEKFRPGPLPCGRNRAYISICETDESRVTVNSESSQVVSPKFRCPSAVQHFVEKSSGVTHTKPGRAERVSAEHGLA